MISLLCHNGELLEYAVDAFPRFGVAIAGCSWAKPPKAGSSSVLLDKATTPPMRQLATDIRTVIARTAMRYEMEV